MCGANERDSTVHWEGDSSVEGGFCNGATQLLLDSVK